jgi:hypothetical protein
MSDSNRTDSHSRAILPIPSHAHTGLTTYDAKDPNTKFPPIESLRPPKGAPNVLIVLLDDVGFAASSAFGGPCQTPNFEKLASGGLKYNRFHTTALCSPTPRELKNRAGQAVLRLLRFLLCLMTTLSPVRRLTAAVGQPLVSSCRCRMPRHRSRNMSSSVTAC